MLHIVLDWYKEHAVLDFETQNHTKQDRRSIDAIAVWLQWLQWTRLHKDSKNSKIAWGLKDSLDSNGE